MSKPKINFAFIALICAALLTSACGYDPSPRANRAARTAAAPALPPAAPLNTDDRAMETAIRFLEERIRRDPDDFAAHNRLASFYLQRARETGSADGSVL